MTDLRCGETDHGEATLLRVAGEVDAWTAPELARGLESALARRPTVLVDLAAVTFIDSVGIGVVLHAVNSHPSGAVKLLNASPPVARLFAICGLDELLAGDGGAPGGVPAGEPALATA